MSAEIAVREVRPAEWRELRDLRLEALATDEDAFGSTLAIARARSDDDWRLYAHDGPHSVTYVAVDDGWFVGMSRGRVLGEDGGLFGMWVAPSHRGRGLGRALVEAVLAWSRDRGLARVLLGVQEHRAPARALYERCGFVPTGRRLPVDHHPGLYDVEMVRDLGPETRPDACD